MIAVALLLSGCGAKTTPKTTTAPTSKPKTVDMAVADRPYVSLIPTADGHWLTLKISKIPSFVNTIEYELLYNAADGTNEIEKGVSGTVKESEITANVERKLLLGTESCTSGCKYAYDNGVYGGTLTLNFYTKDGQVSNYETPFALASSAKLKKDGQIKLDTEDFAIKTTGLTGSDFFVMLKNYTEVYSLFTSGKSPLAKDYPQK